MRRAFGDGGATLVLIGDPKQAIYAFRGADVYAYLEAARDGRRRRRRCEVNWRSDQGLIDAYDALFGGAQLGTRGSSTGRSRAAEANQRPRLPGAPVGAPLRIRVVHRDEPSVEHARRAGYASSGSAREHIAERPRRRPRRAALLGRRDRAPRRRRRTLGRERVRPGHVAVLVRTNRNAALVRDALDDVGVPAVINGAGSVFGTDPARDWLRLLEALERPDLRDRARARRRSRRSSAGRAERVAAADDDEWEDVHRRLHDWARVLRAARASPR